MVLALVVNKWFPLSQNKLFLLMNTSLVQSFIWNYFFFLELTKKIKNNLKNKISNKAIYKFKKFKCKFKNLNHQLHFFLLYS